MVNTFTLDLFKDPFFVGFDRQLDRMLNVHNVSSQINYPPYNVVKVNEDEYVVLELAMRLANATWKAGQVHRAVWENNRDRIDSKVHIL